MDVARQLGLWADGGKVWHSCDSSSLLGLCRGVCFVNMLRAQETTRNPGRPGRPGHPSRPGRAAAGLQKLCPSLPHSIFRFAQVSNPILHPPHTLQLGQQ
jgi:hypothetical protein